MNFNVLVNHAVFNKTVIRKILPNNPKFIGKDYLNIAYANFISTLWINYYLD